MPIKYIKPNEILPGDLIAFSVKTEKDTYSKVKYMYVDETSEDEFENGDVAVACHGSIFSQPLDNKTDATRSEIRKQKLRTREHPSVLLLERANVNVEVIEEK